MYFGNYCHLSIGKINDVYYSKIYFESIIILTFYGNCGNETTNDHYHDFTHI